MSGNFGIDVSAAAAALRAVPSGKLVDFITGKLVDDTPEEYVRQNIEKSLILEYGYNRSQIEVEFSIKLGSGRKSVDLAIFAPDSPHNQESIKTIVETKREGTSPLDKNEGVDQLKSYMSACLNCEDGMWTNGNDRACFRKIAREDQLTFIDSIDIPVLGAKSSHGPSRQYLRAATGDNLLFAFRRCHNYIAGNQGLQKPEAFWELLKIIFCKIEDERSTSVDLAFFVTESERRSMDGQTKVKARLQRLFEQQVVAKYPTIFESNDALKMTPVVVAYVVSELQHYSLLSSPVDVKGVAYEEVVGSNLRGDRGEFFTPRNACRMAVKMINPQPTERIIDPSCGTGGFLVTAMNYVLSKLEADLRRMWRDSSRPSEYELQEFYRRRSDYMANNVVGLDLNPNLVKAAKMNMVMNNDGSASLFQCNSLEHPHRWRDEVQAKVGLGSFDVVFTNPPFGTNIRIDDPRILSQYEVAARWTDKDNDGCELRRDGDGDPILLSDQAPEILFLERCIQLLKPGSGRMAIVLPNGILNNPGNKFVRQFLLTHAQVLAVVDMHRELFMPGNDTQTSMVLLRRKAAHEIEHDYPIYMAIADHVGHDRRGKATFKRNPDGTEILERKTSEAIRVINGQIEKYWVETFEPVLNDDLDEVAEQYLTWLAQRVERLRGVRAG